MGRAFGIILSSCLPYLGDHEAVLTAQQEKVTGVWKSDLDRLNFLISSSLLRNACTNLMRAERHCIHLVKLSKSKAVCTQRPLCGTGNKAEKTLLTAVRLLVRHSPFSLKPACGQGDKIKGKTRGQDKGLFAVSLQPMTVSPE